MTKSELLQLEFEELRLRRDNEEKLVRLWLGICSGTMAGAFALIQWIVASENEWRFVAIFAILAGAFLTGVGVRIAEKIDKEHEVYEGIGNTITLIMSIDYCFCDTENNGDSTGKNIGTSIRKIGSGKGHAVTSDLVRFMALFAGLSLSVFGLIIFIMQMK